MRLEAFLTRSRERFPDKTALIFGERRLTFAEIDERVDRLANALAALDVNRGDRVAVNLENSVELVIAIYAILRAGAVFVLINWTAKPERLNFVLNDSGSRLLITRARKSLESAPGRDVVPGLDAIVWVDNDGDIASSDPRDHRWSRLLTQYPPRPLEERGIDIDLAALIYTSGSTGRPKGVMLSHCNMVAASTSVIAYLKNTDRDIIACALPLSFSYGLYQLVCAVQVGATLLLERSFAYPHVVLQRIADERATAFAMVPTMAAIMLQLDLGSYRLDLRYVTNAGAALPPARALELRRRLPGVDVFLMYGLTECKRVSYLAPEQLVARPDSVGKPMPDVEAYVVDDQGRRLPPGTIGELVVRGANVMRGYWNLPDETARALRPGPLPGERLLYTGDLFRIDDDGYLYFVARRDDIIKCGAEKVSPTEVENVLYRLQGVELAAVYGVPDPILGSVIKAVISLADGAVVSAMDVRRHCAACLDDFMVPRIVEFRSSMPKTDGGKIDKRLLMEHD